MRLERWSWQCWLSDEDRDLGGLNDHEPLDLTCPDLQEEK